MNFVSFSVILLTIASLFWPIICAPQRQFREAEADDNKDGVHTADRNAQMVMGEENDSVGENARGRSGWSLGATTGTRFGFNSEMSHHGAGNGGFNTGLSMFFTGNGGRGGQERSLSNNAGLGTEMMMPMLSNPAFMRSMTSSNTRLNNGMGTSMETRYGLNNRMGSSLATSTIFNTKPGASISNGNAFKMPMQSSDSGTSGETGLKGKTIFMGSNLDSKSRSEIGSNTGRNVESDFGIGTTTNDSMEMK